MAKQSGLGDRLFFGGYDLSNDVKGLRGINSGRSTLEATGINKSAVERIPGLRSGGIDLDAFLNVTNTHTVLKARGTGDTIVTYCRGIAAGSPGASLVTKQINYDGTRDTSGNLSFGVDTAGNGYPLEWGILFGDLTHTTGTSTAALDYGAQTTFGLAAYLHVTALTGTNVVVTLEHSSDNSSWSSVAAFTSATAIGAQRTTFAGTVKRYVRVTSSGVFTSASFAVNFMRREVAEG